MLFQNSPHTYRAIVLEDNSGSREAIEETIHSRNNFFLSGTFDRLELAIKFIEKYEIDLAIVDIGLPDGSGIEFIKHLKKYQSNAKAIIYTMFEDKDTVINGVISGADGYLLKGCDVFEVHQALDTVVQNEIFISPRVAVHLLNMVKSSPQLIAGSQNHFLSRREKEVLQLIAVGYSYTEVSDKLGITYHTVCSYIKTLYSKLKVNSRGAAVLKGVKHGIVSLDYVH